MLAQPLAVRVLGDRLGERTDDLLVLSPGQPGLDQELKRLNSQFLQVRALGHQSLARQVSERWALPQSKRPLERGGGPLRLPVQGLTRLFDKRLEPLQVKLARLEADPIRRATPFDPLGPQQPSEAMDVHVQRTHRRLGRLLAPERFDQLVPGGEAAPSEQERGQQQSLLWLTQGDRPPVAVHLEGSEESELHLAKCLSRRS
jgi:hypothetical protein